MVEAEDAVTVAVAVETFFMGQPLVSSMRVEPTLLVQMLKALTIIMASVRAGLRGTIEEREVSAFSCQHSIGHSMRAINSIGTVLTQQGAPHIEWGAPCLQQLLFPGDLLMERVGESQGLSIWGRVCHLLEYSESGQP